MAGTDVLERFSWPVHEAGYEIVNKRPEPIPGSLFVPINWSETSERPSKPAPIILAGETRMIVPKRASPVKKYCPLDKEHSALFKEFARMPATDAGVLAFANLYGLLGLNYFEGQQGAPVAEDSVELWKQHIRAMKFNSARFIKFSRFFDGSPWPAMVSELCDALNTELRLRVLLQARFESDRVVMGLVPSSLVGALWLQLGWSWSRRTVYRDCLFCHRPFEVATGHATGKRSDAFSCSNACRLRYKRLKDGINVLKAKGFSARAISLQVGRPVEWVKQIVRKKARK